MGWLINTSFETISLPLSSKLFKTLPYQILVQNVHVILLKEGLLQINNGEMTLDRTVSSVVSS
jgi:hypothetical protein